jgi:hypothetical protein
MDISGPWNREVKLTKAEKAKLRRDAKRSVKPRRKSESGEASNDRGKREKDPFE